MNLAHIIQPDNAWQITGTLNHDLVIEHFNLNISSFDTIVTMRRGVDNHFLPYELWVFGCCHEFSLFAKISMFFNLILDKRQSLFYHVKDTHGKQLVFYDIAILEHEELKRPEQSAGTPEDYSVKLTGVTFGYHDKEILHGIDMEMPQGTVNAIVGPSGSGKSTIAKLMDGGSISIGGVDIREMALADYSRNIAYVSQDNYLFDNTVMENIRMGRSGAPFGA